MQPVERAFIERRSGKDRRRFYSIKRFFLGKQDRRSSGERRSTKEMRADWIRVSRWSSAPLQRLKISKFIHK
ncbi:MAG TPA: hypothetical protein VLT88_12630 [Desulfosarcina sp.]|nr:hypothetical protein [Desulfosarcina sp.]